MYALSYAFLEELADQILTDYYRTQRFPLKKIDIEAFAKNYLHLDIQYDQLCYGGETVYAVTAFQDIVIGLPQNNPVVYKSIKANTIILDISLADPKRAGQRAFTLAHECGHHILSMLTPDVIHGKETAYSFCKPHYVNAPQDWWEWQANTFASVFLMNRFLVENMQVVAQHPEKYIVYGDRSVLNSERDAIQRLADLLGVSYSAMLFRLKKMNMVELRSHWEYICDADEERIREGTAYGLFYRPRIFRANPRRARPAEGPITITCG